MSNSLAAVFCGIRLAISEYPIIGRMLVPDSRRNRIDTARKNLSEPVITEVIPLNDSDATLPFVRVMQFVLDVKMHVAYRGVSHRIRSNGNIEMWSRSRSLHPKPFCAVHTVCDAHLRVELGKEYQPIDIEDLISNIWCERCWPRAFLEDLNEWRATRHS
jgi:hypothetical protein